MAADDRAWHTSEYPELRAARPWVMEEMILGEAALAPAAADQPGARARGRDRRGGGAALSRS